MKTAIIYYSKFHKSVLKFAENNLIENKKLFFIYTYGAKKMDTPKRYRILYQKNSTYFG